MEAGHTGRLFGELRAGRDGEPGRGALVGYLPVGYPSVETSLDAFRALTGEGDSPGVDLVEVGLPYSDPVMDGKTIQKAGTRALQRGVRTTDVLRAVETITAAGTPAVVMTYWNLIERYGADAFARDLAAAGGSGIITPDLTPDEAEDWFAASDAHGLDRIFLVSPSTTDQRLGRTLDACRGWVYATAVMGVTGARAEASTAAPTLVQRIRAYDPQARAGVGLGVSNGEQARAINGYADAAIVGSALVQTLVDADEAGRPEDLTALRAVVADLAAGVRAGGEPAARAQHGGGNFSRSTGVVPVVNPTGGTEPADRGRIPPARHGGHRLHSLHGLHGLHRLLVLSILLVVLTGCTSPSPEPRGVRIGTGGDPDRGYHGTVPPDPWPLPDQTFTDTGGHDYNLATTPSKPVTLVFFGYTHCPDVCTGVLSDVARALQRSDASVRSDIGVVFVTTDPRRDSPAAIKAYLDRFDPEFVGLTGRPDRIATAAESIGVEIANTRKLPDGGYEVSHSAQLIAFDKTGRAAVQWLPDTPVADLKADWALLVQRQR